jgi:hypothetical protein
MTNAHRSPLGLLGALPLETALLDPCATREIFILLARAEQAVAAELVANPQHDRIAEGLRVARRVLERRTALSNPPLNR